MTAASAKRVARILAKGRKRRLREFHQFRDRMKARAAIGVVQTLVGRLPLLEALSDRRIAEGVGEFLAQAFAAAHGATEPLECFGCLRHWSLVRVPVAIVVVEPLGDNGGLLAGLCPDCVRDDAVLLRAVKRDFPGDYQILPQPGSA